MASFHPKTLSGLNGLNGFLESGAQAIIPQIMDKVEFYTSISKPASIITGKSVVDDLFSKGSDTITPATPPPPGAGTLFLKALAPTFQLSSPLFGTKYYAPYGRANRDAYKLGKLKLFGGIAVTLVGLLGAGFAFGYNRGKKAR